MKHTLKLNASLILLVAVVYLLLMVTSQAETSIVLGSLTILIAVLIFIGFFEIDRRLLILENDAAKKNG